MSSLVTQSSPEIVIANFNQPTQTVTEQLAFDASLQPGTYWMVETGTGMAAVEPSQTYIGSSVAPVPEPPTIWLFLVAAVGFALLKRKNLWFGRLT